jgi:hypothetical protein
MARLCESSPTAGDLGAFWHRQNRRSVSARALLAGVRYMSHKGGPEGRPDIAISRGGSGHVSGRIK